MSVYIIKSRLKFNIPLCVNYLIFMCFLLPYLQYQASNYTTNHTKLSIFVEFIYESKNIYEKKKDNFHLCPKKWVGKTSQGVTPWGPTPTWPLWTLSG